MNPLEVSIVIPTFARPERLRECLGALSLQRVPKSAYEVVVVDDGSPEALDSLIESFSHTLQIRLIRQSNAGPAAARNRGVRESSGALIAFTDDDCRPSNKWLEQLLVSERTHPGALVGGTTINGLPREIFATTSQLIVDLVYEHFNSHASEAYFLTSNNFLCQRTAFLEIGGFDSVFSRAGGEDRDFCDRWRMSGRRIVWVREALVEHCHSQTLRRFIDLHYRYGRGAYSYLQMRRKRKSGTIRKELGFHRSLVRHLWGKLGAKVGYGRSVGILGLLVLWQVTNAVGFFSQAMDWRASRAPGD